MCCCEPTKGTGKEPLGPLAGFPNQGPADVACDGCVCASLCVRSKLGPWPSRGASCEERHKK